ncbi:MAG: indole-3-glycerol-phosphate synthase [Thermoanaerobaculia bacterium]|nr:indole-3-glycerol-phosphate synthase [Thermoanaerobaculia bacterium]
MSTSPVADILLQITAKRRETVERAKARDRWREPRRRPQLQTPETNPFLGAIASRSGHAVIAEIKMGSPRLGSLEGTFEPLQLARVYASNGAAALSVVVEPDFFFGSYELLGACHEVSGLPAIAKDFIVDPIQIQWAQRSGASAILLIAALYSQEELRNYAQLARQMGLVPLIEVHDLGDLMKLEGAEWELVGVNNRDLRTFEVEIGTSLALLHSLPSEAYKVSESGLAGASEVAMLRSVGFDAFLIGEALVTAEDPGGKLRELVGVRG